MHNGIRLIAIDLDGTLLNTQHQVTPRTYAAIQRAKAAGLMVCIATGRPRRTSAAYLEQLGLETPGVFLQGLTIYDGAGKLLHESVMRPDVARRILEIADAQALTALVYNSEHTYTRAHNERTAKLGSYNEHPAQVVSPIAPLAERITIHKVIFLDDAAEIEALRAQLTPMVGDTATLINSHPFILEALPPGCSKGDGLKWLLNDMGIAPEQVLALGDAENDVEMIALAGIGVAMGNATEHLRAVAKYITDTNDQDGVAKAIERYVFGES